MNKPPTHLDSFKSLIEVVQILRSPTGCPWDKKQTHKSLIPCAIEEVFELVDAIENNDDENTIEELGDLLLQVVLHAQIAKDEGRFDISDIIKRLNKKLIDRHTHVFGDIKVSSSEEALLNWNKNKNKEKQRSKNSFHLPIHLPALQKAQKIGRQMKKETWKNMEDIFNKLKEEINRFQESLSNDEAQNKQEILGDILFSIAQVARHAKVDAEGALRQANKKIENQFFEMKEKTVKD